LVVFLLQFKTMYSLDFFPNTIYSGYPERTADAANTHMS